MTGPDIPTLTLTAVCRNFGGLQAVKDVSESFGPGELNCIIGPNGAGKSTLLNLICGTLPLTSGRIVFGETAIQGLAGDQIARMGIARKFQVPSVFESLNVFENLQVAAAPATGLDDFEEILSTIHLLDDRDIKASDLPHGKKQWLEIGMALAMRPKVLLLDEPTAGLSVDETRDTARFLSALQGSVTVIVIEHDMAFVRDLAARTLVLHHGAVIASGTFADIEADDLVRDVYLGRK